MTPEFAWDSNNENQIPVTHRFMLYFSCMFAVNLLILVTQLFEISAYKWEKLSKIAHCLATLAALFGFVMLILGSVWRYSESG